ncbi:MAG: AAA family ATPase [Acidobacteriota bacterium]
MLARNERSALIVWDPTSKRAHGQIGQIRDLVSELAGEGVQVETMMSSVALPQQTLIPAIREADEVWVAWSEEGPLTSSLQLGVAWALGKPVRLVSRFAEAPFMRMLLARMFEETSTAEHGDLRVFQIDDESRIELGSASTAPTGTFVVGSRSYEDHLSGIRPSWRFIDFDVENTTPEAVQRDLVTAFDSLRQAERLVWILHHAPATDDAVIDCMRAFVAGCFLAVSNTAAQVLHVVRWSTTIGLPELESLTSVIDGFDDLDTVLPRDEHAGDALVVESIRLEDFKSIERFQLDFDGESSLTGDWTCLAGINGAGKSAILQALAIGLMGPTLGLELGSERMRSMIRRGDGASGRARIEIGVRHAGRPVTLSVRLSERVGIEAHAGDGGMFRVWDDIKNELFVSYGATRNLSSYRDTRYSGLDPLVRRQMTMFDPLTQIASVEVLLDGGRPAALGTVVRVLEAVLADNELALVPRVDEGQLVFDQDGARLRTWELPDGFRSAITWLADLCVTWHELHPELDEPVDPATLRGIVLLDELDLHLHPSLQRALVPRLREVLPGIQWIVTTHSPLVLSSFDRHELVLLDRDVEGGVRELDRQILSFSTDQVYEWLMGTAPHSAAMEKKLEKVAADGDATEVALLMYQSEDLDEDKARQKLAHKRDLVKKFKNRGVS